MCGIIGMVGDLRTSVSDPLGHALRVMARRGPDAGGRVDLTWGPHTLSLGVRRLALVSPQGVHAPHVRPSGAALAFNGEVYNHAALRERLLREGVACSEPGDAAVLAAWLESRGMEGLADVRGSYAFVFLAGPQGPLWFARDPVGVRPLCFARVPGGIVVGSTLDALLATGAFPAVPDLDAIADVLRDGVVATHRTALRGVRRVAPGEAIAVDVTLSMASHPTARPHDESGAPDEVLEALRVAVRDRLVLDRPAGLLLSGGIDSALIAALACEVERLPAFTVSYPGLRGFDEMQRARATARRLGLFHTVVPCPLDPTAWVLGTASAFDEPFADASAVPTWGIAREAGREVRALLTGTGGDEVFGGYRRYWLLGAGPWLRHVPHAVHGPIQRVFERRAPGSVRLLRAAADPEGLYRGLLRLQPLEETRALFGPLLESIADPRPRPGPLTAGEAMQEDWQRYLPEDLLVKEDRALMAHAVEGRHPFLDARVRRAAAALALHGSPRRGKQKLVLRAYVREHIDPDLARAPKHGFAFPVNELYRGSLRDLAEDCLLSGPGLTRGFVDPDGIRTLYRQHLRGARNVGQVIHALVMLELWARRVLDAPIATSSLS